MVTPIKGAQSQKKSLRLAIKDSKQLRVTYNNTLCQKNKGTNKVHHLMYQKRSA